MNLDEAAIRIAMGERIKSERLRLSLTPEDLADKASVSRATVYNWERGDRVPDGIALQRLYAVGVDPMVVLTGSRSTPAELPERAQQLVARYADLPSRLQTMVEEVTFVSWLAFDARRAYDYEGALVQRVPCSGEGDRVKATRRQREPATSRKR